MAGLHYRFCTMGLQPTVGQTSLGGIVSMLGSKTGQTVIWPNTLQFQSSLLINIMAVVACKTYLVQARLVEERVGWWVWVGKLLRGGPPTALYNSGPPLRTPHWSALHCQAVFCTLRGCTTADCSALQGGCVEGASRRRSAFMQPTGCQPPWFVVRKGPDGWCTMVHGAGGGGIIWWCWWRTWHQHQHQLPG